MSKKTKICWTVYCAAMAAFIAWLCFANVIVIHFSKVDVPRKISNEMIGSFHNDPLRYAQDSFSVDEELETLNMAGWVFCQTDADNSQRKSSFLLVNEKNSYEIPCENTSRDDLKTALSIDLQNPLVGYRTRSSLMFVKDGIYDLYLTCWENDINSGIADTGKQVVLDKYGCAVISWRGSKIESGAIQATQNESSRLCIDVAAINNENIELKGWTFVEGLDCLNQKVYISLNNEDGDTVQYTTKSVARLDVANAFQEPMYTNSGYTASIPAEDIADGTWTINILVENGGEIWSSAPRTVVKSDNSLELIG